MKSFLLSVMAIAFFMTFIEHAECSEENLENVLELTRQRRQVEDDEDCPEEFVRIGDECITTTDITRRRKGKKSGKKSGKKNGNKVPDVLKDMGMVLVEEAAKTAIGIGMEKAAEALTTTTPAQ